MGFSKLVIKELNALELNLNVSESGLNYKLRLLCKNLERRDARQY